jgi:glycosyltransferase involved in cell wall biosynthesis
MKISLVMIVKNEEKILGKCLESVRDIVDEFVIVDTGSADATKEIILRYGELHEIPFENFVKTKNDALSLATGDYILFMDADETVIEGLEYLREYAEEGKHDCVYAKIIEGEPVSNSYYRARLWRNNGSYKFQGPNVHEVLTGEGGSIRDGRISVRHSHAHRESQSYPERFRMYIELLKSFLEDNPDDERATFYLARTYKDLDEYLNAIQYYNAYLDLDGDFRDERWQAAYDMAVCWKAQGEYERAEDACDLAISIDDRRAEAFVLLGQMHYELQEWAQAANRFEDAIVPIPEDVVLFLDPRAYYEVPLDYLVLVYDRLKDYRAGAEAAAKLAALRADLRLSHNLNWMLSHRDKVIYFCLGYTPEEVYGGMIENQGVGGVETTYLELPVELVKRGHTCFVFCRTAQEHKHNGVYYVPYDRFNEYPQPDVVVTSRWFEPLFAHANAKKIIWAQDAHFKNPEIPNAYQDADAVVCSSLWHRYYIAERFGVSLDANKINVIPLAIRAELFVANTEKDPFKVIYSSNPDRGLYILAEMWNEISQKVPGIHLAVTYGWEGLKTWSDDPAWLEKIDRDRNWIEGWAERAGNVRLTGRLTKAELAKEMLSSSLCLYPNNFWETFCLTALETQAAGTPMITTAIGALNTTLHPKAAVRIDKNPFGEPYKRSFIDHTVYLMGDHEKRTELSDVGKKYIQSHPSWADVAQIWEDMIYEL